jgi:hypothetical protein
MHFETEIKVLENEFILVSIGKKLTFWGKQLLD